MGLKSERFDFSLRYRTEHRKYLHGSYYLLPSNGSFIEPDDPADSEERGGLPKVTSELLGLILVIWMKIQKSFPG